MYASFRTGYRLLSKEETDLNIVRDGGGSEEGVEPLHFYTQQSKLLPGSSTQSIGLFLILALIIFAIGNVSGILLAHNNLLKTGVSLKWLDDSIDVHETVFQYNKSFGKAPSPDVKAAWQSIFPIGRGFIQDPILSPNISGLAVFHELHCLVAIHGALYQSYPRHDNVTEGEHISEAGAGSQQNGNARHTDMHHVRHCFDYLRQSLMCHADTNLEPVDWKAGGVTGWGSRRICRSYVDVVTMAEKLRTHNQTDVS